MPLRPDQLESALQKPGRFWVVAGDEPLLIEESADALRAALRSQGFAQREQFHAEGGFEWDGLANECASPSLFAEQRLLEVRTSGALDAKAAAALQQAFSAAGEDVALLVIAGAHDSRVRKTKWFSNLDQVAQVIYAWRVGAEEAPAWINKRLKSRGLRADRAAVEAIAGCSEGHLLAAAQMVDQLKALVGREEQTVTAEQVWELGADMARFDPFSLMDRVFAGDGGGALRAARQLRRDGTELPAITGGLAFVVRQWHAAQRAYARSGDVTSAAKSGGVFGPRARHLGRALQRSRAGQVQGLLRWLAEIDTAAKQGQGNAAWDDLLTWCSVASGAVSPGFLPRALCKI